MEMVAWSVMGRAAPAGGDTDLGLSRVPHEQEAT